ncbi:MAG: hypothetical protein ABEN55_02560 [Bradymonadaceae bacterium]
MSVNPDEMSVKELVEVLYQRKQKSRKAAEKYRELKDAVAAKVGIPEVGAKTITIGEYKLTIDANEGPAVSDKEHLLEEVFEFKRPPHVPEPVWDIFTFSIRVARTKLEEIEYAHPGWYDRLWSEVLEWKEGRVGVRIYKEEEQE